MVSIEILSLGFSMAQSDFPHQMLSQQNVIQKCLKPAEFTSRYKQQVCKEAGKILTASITGLTTILQQILVREGSKVYQVSNSSYKTVAK